MSQDDPAVAAALPINLSVPKAGLRLLDHVPVFTYATTECAPTYRAIMQMFYESKQRYALELSPTELLAALRAAPFQIESDIEARLDERLDALVRWGNLARSHDTAAVARLDEFYRRRYVYRLTAAGEAAHRAIVEVEASVGRSGSLQANMLIKIRDTLRALVGAASAAAVDADGLMRHFHDLFAAFESLTQEASAFIGDVSRHTKQARLEAEEFHARKRALIAYLAHFLEELRRLKDEILSCLAALTDEAVQRLVAVAATSKDLPPGFDGEDPVVLWRTTRTTRWAGVTTWFCGSAAAPPVVDRLSQLARHAVLDLTRLLTRLNEARSRAADRRADFLTLARWFATCTDNDAAHALWRDAFGLHSARHFHLEEEDKETTSAHTSWWTAPPVHVPAHTRANKPDGSRGRSSAVADYTDQKRFIAQRQRHEREAMQAAMRRFVGIGEISLAALAQLNAAELDCLLSLVDEALTAPREPGQNVRGAVTVDGRLRIALRPPHPDGPPHVLLCTPRGSLFCVNYRLTVEANVAVEKTAS